MDTSPTHRLEVRGGNEVLSRVRAWAARVAASLGADEQAAADFVLAISEAATNVMRYAYAGQAESHFILTAQALGERIVFRVRDFGRKFDPSRVRPPDVDGEPSVGGYGIFLMRRVMDDVQYITDHPIGTELILARRRQT